MPVTAKLSKLFYDRLGEEIATELVNWFNQMDATARADLRELNELNFGRFDAKLEQRTAEVRSELERMDAKLERRLVEYRAEVQSEIHGLETRLGSRIERIEVTLERRLGEQTRWLFGAWAALLIPIIGLWLRG